MKKKLSIVLAIILIVAVGVAAWFFGYYNRKSGRCVKPTTAKSDDKIYDWTWNNLKILVGGAR